MPSGSIIFRLIIILATLENKTGDFGGKILNLNTSELIGSSENGITNNGVSTTLLKSSLGEVQNQNNEPIPFSGTDCLLVLAVAGASFALLLNTVEKRRYEKRIRNKGKK